ncbi:MAG: SDR family oxidoreductase [Candidatus Omnitrophica bacterium]|nr:SDR family oxidoreductase [Candidatus Omnitrophota bacterium]
MRTIREMMDLKGRSALVVGGAGHIGQAVCETILELGGQVVIADQDIEKGKNICADLNKRDYQRKCFFEACDISDEFKTRAIVHAAHKIMGGLDIMVHTAAFVGTTQYPGWAEDLDKQTVEAWDAALRVNLTSAFILIQEARAFLMQSLSPSVILVSSIYGVVAPDMGLYKDTDMKHPLAYGASKAGLIHLAKYFSTVLAPKIRVNCITPGGVWRNQDERFHERYKAKTPLGRMATEEDLKGAVAFLVGESSNYVTGHNLVVDGGWTSW